MDKNSLPRVVTFRNGRPKKGAQTMSNFSTKKKTNDEDFTWVICKEYTNRWGQLMVAADYGYQYWRFRVKRRRKG